MNNKKTNKPSAAAKEYASFRGEHPDDMLKKGELLDDDEKKQAFRLLMKRAKSWSGEDIYEAKDIADLLAALDRVEHGGPACCWLQDLWDLWRHHSPKDPEMKRIGDRVKDIAELVAFAMSHDGKVLTASDVEDLAHRFGIYVSSVADYKDDVDNEDSVD